MLKCLSACKLSFKIITYKKSIPMGFTIFITWEINSNCWLYDSTKLSMTDRHACGELCNKIRHCLITFLAGKNGFKKAH